MYKKKKIKTKFKVAPKIRIDEKEDILLKMLNS